MKRSTVSATSSSNTRPCPSPPNRKIPYADRERFWNSFVPRITFDGETVAAIELFPIVMGFAEPAHDRGTPRLATGDEAQKILERIAALSKPYGTEIEIAAGEQSGDRVGRVKMPAVPATHQERKG